jgi:hypothetical protein
MRGFLIWRWIKFVRILHYTYLKACITRSPVPLCSKSDYHGKTYLRSSLPSKFKAQWKF